MIALYANWWNDARNMDARLEYERILSVTITYKLELESIPRTIPAKL